MAIEGVAWMQDAACKGKTELFYPEHNLRGEELREATRRAKALCYVCPVKEKCKAWAQENNEKFGVWGGLLPEQRDPAPPKKNEHKPPVRRCKCEDCKEVRRGYLAAHRKRKKAQRQGEKEVAA